MKKPVQVFDFSFQNNATSEEVDIHIDGQIVDASTQAMIEAWFGDTTSVSYRSFRDQVNKLDAKVYNVYINAPGGHVGDALAMYDFLLELQNKGKVVNTYGRGIVASSATLLLLASKTPKMSRNSFFMIHTVSGGIYGTVAQVEAYGKNMRKFNDMVVDIYNERSNAKLTKDLIDSLMVAETFLTAKEAADYELITLEDIDTQFKNVIPEEFWEYSNKSVLNLYNSSVKKPELQTEDMDIKTFLTNFKNEILTAFNGQKPAKEGQPLTNEQMAEALSKPFENFGASIEAAITEQVTAQVGTVTTDFEAKLNTLKTELETEITNKIGNKTVDPKQEGGTKPIGGFSAVS